MLDKLIQFIENQNLFTQKDKLLLAVSGGVDSIVMLDLLYKTGYNISVAHVNFNLRGDDSKGDEVFVSEYAKKLNIPIFILDSDTYLYIEKNKISLQEAARNIRYNWFAELTENHGFNYTLTAHHLDDQVETMLINLIRGTGLSGLHGILNKNKNIVRPLMFATNEMIRQYAKENNLRWREDKTNAESKYLRNYLRNIVIPKLNEVGNDLSAKFNTTAKNIHEAEKIIESHIEKIKAEVFQEKEDLIFCNWTKIGKLQPIDTYLFFLLKDFGFQDDIINNLCKTMQSETPSGKKFYSEKYCINTDRERFIISEIQKSNNKEESFTFPNCEELLSQSPDFINFEIVSTSQIETFSNPKIAYFDFDKIEFPIEIRKWQVGDKISPFGSDYSKKISDIFIDKKISVIEKGRTWIVSDIKSILWLVGIVTSNYFKIKNDSKTVLKCTFMT